ncbi:MAG: hypothetical protein NUV65_06415 [Candidatus Roizmanbacteria bacterium]|nr:hypothetical protein [Candidatus Roizmanbacteria bacterium]
MKINTVVFMSLAIALCAYVFVLVFPRSYIYASCYSGQTLCSDGVTCVDFQSDCPPLSTNTPIPPTITPTPQPQCSASCRRTETINGTCGAGSCSIGDRRTGIVYDYKQTWNGTCTDTKCPDAVADVCTADTSCGNGGGNTPTPTGTGNPPTATPTSAQNPPTPTSVPPTPTPTIVLLPPAKLTEPPVCSNDGWTATFQWSKSPSVETTDYVFRSEYPDIPSPLWLVADSTDIWKSTKSIQHAYTGSQTDLVVSRNIFPNNRYLNWSIESVANDYTANAAHRTTSTQGYMCKPLRVANPANCTTACEPNIGVWKEEFTYASTYKSQDLNGDEIVDIVDFEKIRALKYVPTSTPTPIPPTPTPVSQVQINIKNQQGEPVAANVYRLQCLTSSGQCSTSFLQSQGVNSCRHDNRNTNTTTLTTDIQSGVCKAGAGIQYNPSSYIVVGVTGVPERAQEFTYTSTTAQEKNVVWDTDEWTTGKRTIDIIVATPTPVAQ